MLTQFLFLSFFSTFIFFIGIFSILVSDDMQIRHFQSYTSADAKHSQIQTTLESSVNRNRLFFIEFLEMIGSAYRRWDAASSLFAWCCISRIEFRFEKYKSTIQNVNIMQSGCVSRYYIRREEPKKWADYRSIADDDVPGDVQTFKLTNPMVIQWVLPALSRERYFFFPFFNWLFCCFCCCCCDLAVS